MCTRQENLRRHFKRLHNGRGNAILQYIFGNSIVTPEEAIESRSLNVLADEYSKSYSDSASLNREISIDYNDVSGFIADICQKCFAIRIIPIGTSELSLLKNHKCYAEMRNSTLRLSDSQYELELGRKINLFPELLFKQCKEWARNTSRQVYLIATKIGPSNQNEFQNYGTPIYSDTLLLFSRVIEKSNILLNDEDLHEYLKVAKNQTRTIVIDSSNSRTDLRYILDISTARSM
jgi:hypothetical protein